MRLAPKPSSIWHYKRARGVLQNSATALTLRAHIRIDNPMGRANSNQINALLTVVPELCPKDSFALEGHNF